MGGGVGGGAGSVGTRERGGGVLGSQMAERLGNRTINQKVVGSIPGRAKWARHFTLIPSGRNVPVFTVSLSG